MPVNYRAYRLGHILGQHEKTGVIAPFRHGRLSQTELRRREQVAEHHEQDSLVCVKKQTAYPRRPVSASAMYMKGNAFKKGGGARVVQGTDGAVPFGRRQGIKEGHGEFACDSHQNVDVCACVI